MSYDLNSVSSSWQLRTGTCGITRFLFSMLANSHSDPVRKQQMNKESDLASELWTEDALSCPIIFHSPCFHSPSGVSPEQGKHAFVAQCHHCSSFLNGKKFYYCHDSEVELTKEPNITSSSVLQESIIALAAVASKIFWKATTNILVSSIETQNRRLCST